ncbi:hypothetical protein [Neisseria montereyensis]|uniref:Uncharacterized protein n=1 Tax=Neisseria montereyensis TaxID=2973938 RepID=A0ABT2FC30_9NEIS|nr:hypothetical protein [Neisseria montereyensis]MCS4533525.1 hypothetical protein [Neisseria montereyensis]
MCHRHARVARIPIIRVRSLHHTPYKGFIPKTLIQNNPITLTLYQSSRPSEKQSSDGLKYWQYKYGNYSLPCVGADYISARIGIS